MRPDNDNSCVPAPTPNKLLMGGIVIASYALITLLPTPEGLTPNGQKAIALMAAAVLAWVFEVLPLAAASILFTVLPAVMGVMPLPKVMGHFATPILFFLFAMFCTCIAFQNSGLSRRLVVWLSMKSGGSAKRLLFLMMMACGLLSTILADLPVIAMMMPVALLVLRGNGCEPGCSMYGRAMMLGLPIACLIGGVGTPAGGAPNMLTIGLLESTANVKISFFEWSLVGIPMVLVLVPVAWWILVKVFPPEIIALQGMDAMTRDYTALGPMRTEEKRFLLILAVNLLLWSTDRLHGIPLPAVSVMGGTLFCLPGVGLVNWNRDGGRVGWDIIMLVGAANALGMSIWESGGALWIADRCLGGVASLPLAAIIAGISLFTVVIHLLIPIAPALIVVLLPAVVALAGNMGVSPALLALPMGFSASASLLLPIETITLVTYPAGYYRMFDMFRPGMLIALCWVAVMTALMLLVGRPLGLL